MASMQELRRKMDSITITAKITKAMRMVAAAKLRKFRNLFTEVNEFYHEFYDVIGKIIGSCGSIAQKKVDENAPTLFVILSSSLGLCGAYNIGMNKLLYSMYKKNDKIMPLGKKSIGYWKTKGLEDALVAPKDLQDNDINFGISLKIGNDIFADYEAGKYGKVVIVYSHFVNTLVQEAKSIQVLPIDTSLFKNDSKKTESMADFDFEPDKREVLAGLTPQFLQAVLYGSMIESKVSEYASRQNAMETATNNATDLFNNYLLDFNQLRQASITQEITEIVAGSEQ
ncbi:ATP synthase F1 subunit gamma [[Mycoplasma] testudinis]|uniref:ATP synthase F1 subunit gamma n=1 Tax=[Mycoplasma] testudinis TaxID=33924 RepID=UPI000488ADDB|nr:ATP synthase F1 subunit gamma [[Mycoplasma] testudinis]